MLHSTFKVQLLDMAPEWKIQCYSVVSCAAAPRRSLRQNGNVHLNKVLTFILIFLLLSSCTPQNAPPGELDPITIRSGKLYAGSRVFELRGINYTHQTGANMALCGMLQFGADGNCPWDMSVIESDFVHMQALGVNSIRVFLNYYVFGGARESQPNYDLEPALAHFEEFVRAANRHGIYVMPVLMAKYPQDTFGAAYYERTLALHVRPVVSRLSGMSGILAWDIFNEPDIGSPINIRCWDWDNGDEPACLPMAEERMRFLQVVHDEVKRLAPKQLVTTSMAFGKSYFEPQQAFMRMADVVDFYSVHYYDDAPHNSGRYAQHWYYGKGLPADLEQLMRELNALKLGKPIVISELGFPTGPDDWRKLTDMQRDSARSLEVIRANGGSGVLLWPFQEKLDELVGELFQ